MRTLDAIEQMIESTGNTKAGVSVSLGKHKNFLSTTFYKKSVPRVDTLAKIASVLGYKLILEKDDDRIEIDPL